MGNFGSKILILPSTGGQFLVKNLDSSIFIVRIGQEKPHQKGRVFSCFNGSSYFSYLPSSSLVFPSLPLPLHILKAKKYAHQMRSSAFWVILRSFWGQLRQKYVITKKLIGGCRELTATRNLRNSREDHFQKILLCN